MNANDIRIGPSRVYRLPRPSRWERFKKWLRGWRCGPDPDPLPDLEVPIPIDVSSWVDLGYTTDGTSFMRETDPPFGHDIPAWRAANPSMTVDHDAIDDLIDSMKSLREKGTLSMTVSLTDNARELFEELERTSGPPWRLHVGKRGNHWRWIITGHEEFRASGWGFDGETFDEVMADGLRNLAQHYGITK